MADLRLVIAMVERDLRPAEAEDRLMVSLPVKLVRKLLLSIDADKAQPVDENSAYGAYLRKEK